MTFGQLPESSTTASGVSIPVSSAFVPGTAQGNLTAVEGIAVNTDGSGYQSTAVRFGAKDGDLVTVGTSTDAANANTVMGQLKQIKSNTASVVVSTLPALPAGTNVIGHVVVDSAGNVSVTSLPSLPAGTNVIGHVIVDSASSVSVTSLPALPAGSNLIGNVELVDSAGTNKASISAAGAIKVDNSAVTQPVSGTVTANVGTTNGLALDTSVNGVLVAQGSTTSGEKGPLVQAAVTTAAPTYTTAQTSPLSLTTAGALRVDGSAVTQPVSGTVSITTNSAVNVAQFGGANTVTGTGASGAGVPRVTVSSDSAVKHWDGTNTTNVLAAASVSNAASAQAAALYAGAFAEQASLSASALNADLVPSTDVSNYKWFSLHINTSVYSGTLTFQCSNDNSNWTVLQVYNVANGTQTTVAASISNTLYAGAISFRYLRVRMTAYASGTAQGTLELYTSPASWLMVNAYQAGNWNINIRDTSANTLTSTSSALDQNLKLIGGTAVVTGGASGLLAVGGPVASGASNADNPLKVGGVFNTTQPTVTTGQIVDLQATARGAAIVATGADTFNITVNAALPAGSNTIGAVTQASGPWSQNLTQVAGASIATGNNAVPVLASASTGYVSAYGSNPATTGIATDVSFKWGAGGTTQVNHIMLQNNTAASINWDLDTATNAGSPVLAAGQTLFLDVQTTALHLQAAASQNINGSSAGNIVVRGWL